MSVGRRWTVSHGRMTATACLAFLAMFVFSFGIGFASWAWAACGVALLAAAFALYVVSAVNSRVLAWVPGTAHVLRASDPPSSRAQFGRCQLQMVVHAPGQPDTVIRHRDVAVPVSKWPDDGATLPVMVSLGEARRVRILWDDVPSHASVAERYRADQTAVAERAGYGEDLGYGGEDLGYGDDGGYGADRRYGADTATEVPADLAGDPFAVAEDEPTVPRQHVPGEPEAGDQGGTDQWTRPRPGPVTPATAAPGRRRPSPRPRPGTATMPATAPTGTATGTVGPVPASRRPTSSPTPAATGASVPRPAGPADPSGQSAPGPAGGTEPGRAGGSGAGPAGAPGPGQADSSAPAPPGGQGATPDTGQANLSTPTPPGDPPGGPGPTPDTAQANLSTPTPPGDPGGEPSRLPWTGPSTGTNAGPRAGTRDPEPVGAVRGRSGVRAATAGQPGRPPLPHPRGGPQVGPVFTGPPVAAAQAGPTAAAQAGPTAAAQAGPTAAAQAGPATAAGDATRPWTPAQGPAPAQRTGSADTAPERGRTVHQHTGSGTAAGTGGGPVRQVELLLHVPAPVRIEGMLPVRQQLAGLDPAVTAPERGHGGGATPDGTAGVSQGYLAAAPPPAGRPGSRIGPAVTLFVSDPGRSADFYRGLLGLTEIDRNAGTAILRCGGGRLVLRRATRLSRIDPRMVHLLLEVADLPAAYQDLRARAVRFVHGPRIVARDGAQELWAATFRDPEGHGLALIEWREPDGPDGGPAPR